MEQMSIVIALAVGWSVYTLIFSKKTKAREYAESILVALILALWIRTYVVQAFKIPSGSMIPTLNIGDRLVATKFSYRFHEPKRGDIVIFKSTIDQKKEFVKRLIGLPGDVIEIKNGQIWINGARPEHPKIQEVLYTNIGQWGGVGEKIVVPKDSYFVLGDNSPNSRDSRYWGFVPKQNVNGRVWFVYWPLSEMRVPK